MDGVAEAFSIYTKIIIFSVYKMLKSWKLYMSPLRGKEQHGMRREPQTKLWETPTFSGHLR